MDPIDEKITKLLNLTRSENDHEALAAVRKANRLLDSKGMLWPEFFSGNFVTIPPAPQNRPAPANPLEDIIFNINLDDLFKQSPRDRCSTEGMLKHCTEKGLETDRHIINRLWTLFYDTGRLVDHEERELRRCWNNCR